MSRSVIAAAVVGLVVLAGCDGTPEPSPPPTSEPALTTATVAPDDIEQTSEAAPSTEAPEETDAGGAPEMPEEATEQTEAGAETFVEYYVERVNEAYVTGDTIGLEDLSTPDCASCESLTAAVPEDGIRSDYLALDQASAELLDEDARVTAEVQQLSGEGAGSGTLIFRLVRAEEQWLVDSITLEEQ